MRAAGGGSIVNIGSILSFTGDGYLAAYTAMKSGVLGLTKAVAIDYAVDGIRCNCVCPARVHTPFVDGFIAKNYPGQEKEMFAKLSAAQPIGRMGQPDDIANAVVFLASDYSAFTTGQKLLVTGGGAPYL